MPTTPEVRNVPTEVGAGLDDRARERGRAGRADRLVDVEAVGTVADRGHARAELGEHLRRDLVGRAVRAVEHDVDAVEPVREGGQQMQDVAVLRIGEAPQIGQPPQ